MGAEVPSTSVLNWHRPSGSCQHSVVYLPHTMQPERINPTTTGCKYDERSDVWSYGITMVTVSVSTCMCVCVCVLCGYESMPLSTLSAPAQYELAVGKFPYPPWVNVFDQLKTVVEGSPPRISKDVGLSENFTDFVHQW